MIMIISIINDDINSQSQVTLVTIAPSPGASLDRYVNMYSYIALDKTRGLFCCCHTAHDNDVTRTILRTTTD